MATSISKINLNGQELEFIPKISSLDDASELLPPSASSVNNALLLKSDITHEHNNYVQKQSDNMTDISSAGLTYTKIGDLDLGENEVATKGFVNKAVINDFNDVHQRLTEVNAILDSPSKIYPTNRSFLIEIPNNEVEPDNDGYYKIFNFNIFKNIAISAQINFAPADILSIKYENLSGAATEVISSPLLRYIPESDMNMYLLVKGHGKIQIDVLSFYGEKSTDIKALTRDTFEETINLRLANIESRLEYLENRLKEEQD